MLRVVDDADDGDPVRLIRGLDAFANRITRGPDVASECLIDDGDERRLQIVAIGEIATPHDPDSQRLEVIGGNQVVPRDGSLARLGLLTFGHV